MTVPYFVYLSTYPGKAASGQSAYATFSFSNTAGFEAWIPIKIWSPNTANLSAGAEVYVCRSTDGGASYETVADAPLGAAFSKPAAAAIQLKDVLLRDPGMYLISILVGGGSASTWSIDFGATIAQISAYA